MWLISGVPRRISWEGESRKTERWGPPRKWEWARGLQSQILKSSRGQEVGTSKLEA